MLTRAYQSAIGIQIKHIRPARKLKPALLVRGGGVSSTTRFRIGVSAGAKVPMVPVEKSPRHDRGWGLRPAPGGGGDEISRGWKDVQEVAEMQRQRMRIQAASRLQRLDGRTIRKDLIEPVARPEHRRRPEPPGKLG